jgi:hypothetical protein
MPILPVPPQYASAKPAHGTDFTHKRRLRRDIVGLCLNCGRRLTLCGEPFTLEIQCAKCFRINVYIDSIRPVSLR